MWIGVAKISYDKVVHVIAWFHWVFGTTTEKDIFEFFPIIFGKCWNTKSSIYAKYPEETMLLFVYCV